MKTFSILFIALFLINLPNMLANCSQSSKDSNNEDQKDRAQIVQTNDFNLSAEYIRARLKEEPLHVRHKFSASIEEKKAFIEKMIDEAMLIKEVKKRKIDERAAVKKRIHAILLSELRRDLYSEADRYEPTDSEIEEYFKENHSSYERERSIRASMIILGNEKETQALYRAWKNHPPSQDELEQKVAQHDIDENNRRRRGDLGFFSRKTNRIEPYIVQTAFSLDGIGAVSQPIRMQKGWALVVKTEEQPGFKQNLDNLRSLLKLKLKEKHRQELEKRIISKNKIELDVKVNQEALQQLEIN